MQDELSGVAELCGVQYGCKETLTHLTPPRFLFLFRERLWTIYFLFTQCLTQDVSHKTET